jgi:hypothetical protein
MDVPLPVFTTGLTQPQLRLKLVGIQSSAQEVMPDKFRFAPVLLRRSRILRPKVILSDL